MCMEFEYDSVEVVSNYVHCFAFVKVIDCVNLNLIVNIHREK